MVHDHVHVRPHLKLPLPVTDSGERNNHKVWSFHAEVFDFLQEGNGLDGFSEAHFIGKDTVLPGNKTGAYNETFTHKLWCLDCRNMHTMFTLYYD